MSDLSGALVIVGATVILWLGIYFGLSTIMTRFSSWEKPKIKAFATSLGIAPFFLGLIIFDILAMNGRDFILYIFLALFPFFVYIIALGVFRSYYKENE